MSSKYPLVFKVVWRSRSSEGHRNVHILTQSDKLNILDSTDIPNGFSARLWHKKSKRNVEPQFWGLSSQLLFHMPRLIAFPEFHDQNPYIFLKFC